MKLGRPAWNAPSSIFSEYPRKSLAAIAREHGVAPDTVKMALLRNGIPLRPLKEALGTILWTKKQLLRIRRAYEKEKKPILRIAESMGAGYKGVRGALLRMGVVLRSPIGNGPSFHSEKTKQKMRLLKMGEKNPNWGTHLSEKAKKHLRQINMGRKLPEYACRKMSKTRIERGLSRGRRNPMSREDVVRKWIRSNHLKPNRAETVLYCILNKLFPGEYKLNVRGERLILEGKIPDFVRLGKKKEVIELYGDYWHRGEDESVRIRFFKQRGYRALIVWERELKSEKLIGRLKRFHSATT